LWAGWAAGWLVVPDRVDGELANEFAGGGVDDADVQIVDEHQDWGPGVLAADLFEGTFTAPAGPDPVQQVIGPLAPSPHLHEVSIRIRADIAHVRTRIPETLASVTPARPDHEEADG